VSHIETDLPEMKNHLVLCLTLTLIACGPSQDEKEKIAAVSCAVMGETRNMDGAIRVREMNAAREKIGGEPFLRGDDVIKEAFEYRLCEELVLNVDYDGSLENTKKAIARIDRIDAEERAERERITTEERTERERIATEKRAEEERIATEIQKIRTEIQRVADSEPTVKELFHPNGELAERTNYQPKSEGGRRHGLSRLWYENGQLRRENTYKDGERRGLSRGWVEDGELVFEDCYSNGEEVDMSNCQG
jgi:hypothetical protein